jgi:UDP-3-O-[3-hydroxymyristoyl] glucosamine N-acyltransferase
MKILITNVQLDHRTGTEIVVRDLDRELRRRGHEVCVLTPSPGELAAEMVADGATVVRSVDSVPFVPDVIHGHHHTPTLLAMDRFTRTPAIFVCHDRRQSEDAPPVAPMIHRYVAVDLNCRERLVVENGIDPDRVVLVHNAVDLARLPRRSPLPERPGRALVFSNAARAGTYLDAISAACEQTSLDLAVVGEAAGRLLPEPAVELARADIVFAKARSALEAIAVGAAVVLVDEVGLGPMVTSSEASGLRDWNFGARCLQGRVTADAVVPRIDSYDAADAAAVTTAIREVADLARCVDRYERLYDDAIRWGADEPASGSGWPDDVRSLLQRLGRLETLAFGPRRHPFDNGLLRPPLPPTIGDELSIRVDGGTRTIEVGSDAWWSVTIDNRSNETLVSIGANPVHLACHLVDRRTGEMSLFEGERAELTAPVGPGTRHVQRLRQRAPSSPGRHLAIVTLVQEGVFWFDELPSPVCARVPLEVRPVGDPLPLERQLADVALDIGATVVRDGRFTTLGFSSHDLPGMVSFATSPGHVRRAVENGASALLVPSSLVPEVGDRIGCAVVDEPAAAFAALHHLLLDETAFYGSDEPTHVDATASVHPGAHVDPVNVVIGPGCTVHAGAVLTGRVRLGSDVVVFPNAVLGSSGFQRLVDPSGRPGQYRHAGAVEVGDGAQVMAGAVVARGLFRQVTRIGEGTIVGNQAFLSHNAVVGARCHVGHGSVVNGNVTIGDDVWIGPGATVVNDVSVGDGARVALGSVVVSDVDAGGDVAPIPSMSRWAALRAGADLARRDRGRPG